MQCPHDGTDLIVRETNQPGDDSSPLEVYAKSTSEVVRFYQGRPGYRRVDASQPVEELAQSLLFMLGEAASEHRTEFRAGMCSLAASVRLGLSSPKKRNK